MKSIDISNQVFGRWTVISRAQSDEKGQAQWLCRCECGNERVMKSILLRRGISRSCGCFKHDVTVERSTRHGHSSSKVVTPTYHSWVGMTQRCGNPKNSHYNIYGGRGIKIYEPWLKFANFLADMGEKPPGTSLDRIDSDGNYEPGNCRWATPTKQARNKRNNHNLTFHGKTYSIAEWAERLGIRAATINDRLSSGWDIDKTLSTPDGTISDNIRTRNMTFNGETHTLSEWSRRVGISIPTICRRLKRGWSDEKALTIPVRPAVKIRLSDPDQPSAFHRSPTI